MRTPRPTNDFRSISSVLNVRDTALTGYLIQVLEKENIKLPEQVEDMLYKAAEEFQSTDAGRHFLREAQTNYPHLIRQ
jgi:glycerate-2-kinase